MEAFRIFSNPGKYGAFVFSFHRAYLHGKTLQATFFFSPPLRNGIDQRCVIGGGFLHFYGMVVQLRSSSARRSDNVHHAYPPKLGDKLSPKFQNH